MMLQHSTLSCLLVLVACSGEVASSGGGPSGGSAHGGADASAPCEDEKQALVQLLEENRACEIDDDCQYLISFCLEEGRVDCTGAFYVNMNVAAEVFESVDSAHTECMQANSDTPDSPCGTCTGTSRLAFCDTGICAASDQYDL